MSKKLLLLLNLFFISLLFIHFSSFANQNQREGIFYLKPLIIVNKVNDVKESDQKTNFNLQHESILTPSIGAGAGYYINDTTRVDLIFEHLQFYFPKESSSFNYIENNTLNVGTKSVKRKVFGNSLIVNGYVDIINKDSYTIFVGMGAGVIQIKEKIYYSLAGNSIRGNHIYTYPLITENLASITTINFAHSLMLGTSITVAPKISLELMYSWKDFGKTKIKALDDEFAPIRNKYKGHHLSMGMRFDL